MPSLETNTGVQVGAMAWERQDRKITFVSNGLMSFEFTVVVCVLKCHSTVLSISIEILTNYVTLIKNRQIQYLLAFHYTHVVLIISQVGGSNVLYVYKGCREGEGGCGWGREEGGEEGRRGLSSG